MRAIIERGGREETGERKKQTIKRGWRKASKELKERRKTFLIVSLLEALISPLRMSRYCHCRDKEQGPRRIGLSLIAVLTMSSPVHVSHEALMEKERERVGKLDQQACRSMLPLPPEVSCFHIFYIRILHTFELAEMFGSPCPNLSIPLLYEFVVPLGWQNQATRNIKSCNGCFMKDEIGSSVAQRCW